MRINKFEFEVFVVDENTYNLIKDKILQFKSISSDFKSGIISKSDNKILIITFDDNKIENLIKILYEHGKITLSEYNKIIYDVYKFLSTSYSDIVEIKNEYKNTIINKNGITIIHPITPYKFLYKNKIFEIPIEDRSKITSFEFIVNNENKILSLKIDGKHPNADKNNEFCLGDLKFLDLKLKSITAIITTTSIYNMNNSYYMPNSIKSIINSIDIK